MLRVLIWIALPLCVAAQIRDLATTNDGSVLYFSTVYRQKGTDQPGYPKIFRYSEKGLELFREFPLIRQGHDTNFNQAVRPCVSGDGSVVAYTRTRDCTGSGMHCGQGEFEFYDGWLATPDGSDQHVGTVMIELSEDGRYALVFDQQGLDTFAGACDLTQPCAAAVPALRWIGDGRHDMTNGGIALLGAGVQGPALRNGIGGPFQPLPFAFPISAQINATATTILYEVPKKEPVLGLLRELHSYDIASGRDLVIATAESGGPSTYFHASLTRDGAQAAYMRDGAIEVAWSDGSGIVLHVDLGEDAADAVISGFGNAAYVATASGRVVRIDVASGVQTEIIPSTPHIERIGGSYTPGGRLDVESTGEPALLTDGPPAPIIARSGAKYTLQVPWEASPGSTSQLTAGGNASPFQEVHAFELSSAAPVFFSMGDNYAIAAHQDFSALVTPDRPARSGEIVHFYLTGMGPVVPAIATGSVTPVGTVYYLQTLPSCGISAFATVVFAGLAPTFIGIEQVDLVIPSISRAALVTVYCGSASASISVAP